MIWSNLIIVVQVISALSIIGLVLMQHGKGADMGAAFGSGASGSLFGASGSSNFLSKATAVAAAVFFGTTLTLAYIGNNRTGSDNAGVMGRAQAPAAGIPVTAPVQTAPADVPTLPAGSAVPAAPAAGVPAAPPTPAPATR
ncbi:preprotein translocase subunit SecG [Massilia aurea]|uniref:preprotein translocase subunit SecG n=1 Tax=Massilia aurea TaxID=373040 RepID=UPI002161ADA1|nr:preprotein translocase subunit SecG [Massilia aurea]MCS0706357.1 preprotein translocase subunit SecG [Massilia aurea]